MAAHALLGEDGPNGLLEEFDPRGLRAAGLLGAGRRDRAPVGQEPEAREYGDDIFLLDPGMLMVPSFMGDRPVAAMHGYDPAHPAMAALLLSNRPIPEAVDRLAAVRGFLEAEVRAARASTPRAGDAKAAAPRAGGPEAA